MTRASIALVTLALLGGQVSADCLILKKGGKLQVWGMPATVGKSPNEIEITPENADLFADQSTGLIETEGYDAITAKKAANAKAESFPKAEVVRAIYTTDPEALVSGLAEMATGQYLAAVGDFKQVVAAEGVREAYKYRALFEIGRCYYLDNRINECIKHYSEWKPVNSIYTPIVYRLLADLLTSRRDYEGARKQYDQIQSLPGITDVWKFNGRLGAVKVDIAERKYDEAERTAAAIARETQNKPDVADALANALALQAEAIWRGGKTERLVDATTLLERGAAIEGVEPGTRAFVLVTQGNVLYAQGKPEEARYPYLRAALMYPDSGFDALAYLNAGQCFLDMSGREAKDPVKSDQLLVKGMRLLATAAGTYKSGDAAKRYRENKERYDAIVAKEGDKPAEEPTPGK
jgi:tetratricopeptide (TPR) repeat protein